VNRGKQGEETEGGEKKIAAGRSPLRGGSKMYEKKKKRRCRPAANHGMEGKERKRESTLRRADTLVRVRVVKRRGKDGTLWGGRERGEVEGIDKSNVAFDRTACRRREERKGIDGLLRLSPGGEGKERRSRERTVRCPSLPENVQRGGRGRKEGSIIRLPGGQRSYKHLAGKFALRRR